MKRFRSSEDLDSYGDKGEAKDWGRRDDDTAPQRSSSSMHRSSYYKPSDSGRKVITSPRSRYDRVDEDRESSRPFRKRSNYDLDSYDRRKNYDRQRDAHERVNFSSSPRAGYDAHRTHRSESFSGPRRDFPKGFRSERDRPRRENIVTSWRRFGGGKDCDEGTKSANESSRGSRMESEDIAGKVKSPKAQRDVKSPALSKESGSERSKSVDGKNKYEDNNTTVESFVPSNEREEGELEPDPQPSVLLAKSVMKDEAEIELDSSQEKLMSENPIERKVLEDTTTSSSVEKGDDSKARSPMKLEESGISKDVRDVVNTNEDLQKCRDTDFEEVIKSGDEDDMNGEKEGSNNVIEGRGEGSFEEEEEEGEGMSDDKLSSLQEQGEDKSNNNIETNTEGLDLAPNVETTERNKMPLTEPMIRNTIDKGKGVLEVSPSSSPNYTGIDFGVENKPRDVMRGEDEETEGPSTIGFQFFSSDPVKKKEKVEQSTPNKPKDDKMEALELSLSLPNILLPIGAQGGGQAPGSPSHGRSIQSFASSFRTSSDGFTASMSFSGSQHLTHNPSCSLNHDMYDYEKSVGSKPLFKGMDWKALAADENKSKDEPAYPRISSKENLNQQSQVSKGNSSGQAMVNSPKVAGGSSNIPVGLERQLSFNKQNSGSQGFVSYRNGSEKRKLIVEKDSNSVQKNNYPHGNEPLVVGNDFAESIVTMIASEPLHVMTRRFSDMTAQHIMRVKEFVHDIISNPSKQWQLSALQKSLQKRPDITLDMLLTAHRVQLLIMTALRTGIGDFVLPKLEISSSDLAEIFLNMRCKNPNCRSVLPVDDCDCRICARQNDFCRECMCLVCSKFDTAANTCSWVGCDVCLHWCHTDCGLRESHIRNGLSAKGVRGTTEMQFYCIACNHPSEMFGFVKEVFQNFVKAWTLDNLSRELEYVRRIFCCSDDVRGKRLHEFAVRMLSRLSGRVELEEAKNHIMSFFNESDSDKPSATVVESRKEIPAKIHDDNNNGTGVPRQEWGKAPHLGNPINIYPNFDSSMDEKREINMDFQRSVQREPPVFDELESIVRIKQAEAKMFQSRADDARKESEALKRISISKSERVEEEYRSRISKLRLAEAEEMRKQKIEELQAVQRSYQEYFNMKMRMESEIKDLLLKMESTRRNLTL